MNRNRQASDILRVVYKRRWLAVIVFVLIFVYGATTSLRKTPIYEATTQLLIEENTEILMLQSRALAWRALGLLGMDQPPSESERQALAEATQRQVEGGWIGKTARFLGAPKAIEPPSSDESAWQSARIDRFLGGLEVEPVKDSRLVNVRYKSADPSFASRAANALSEAYVSQGTLREVVDAAEMPRVPALPNHQRDLVLALLTGLLISLTLAFGVEYLDIRIKTPDDIKSHLGLPFLGLVPVVPNKQLKGLSPLIDRGAPPPFSEAIRSIRTSLVFSSAAEGARMVMVTSTAPSEGKTVVSTNLGHALSQAEQRTLIIDGDMRRPRVHEVFTCAQEPGLSNVLVGTAELKDAIRSTGNPFLSLLPAGQIPPNPAELLGTPRYRQLLETLGREYDWVIVDAPPVMAVTDAAVISNGMNGVVFVVGADMTPRRAAQMALDQLAMAQAKVIGAVLNRVNVHKHSYYYAQYYRQDYSRAHGRTP